MTSAKGAWFLVGAATVVVIATVAGLLVLGSPTEERARRIDARRVTDLQGIAAATNLFWTRHSRLPETLDDLASEPGVVISSRDPEAGEPYGYAALDSMRYELCAVFDLASEEMRRDPDQDIWAHGTGPQCFELEAEDITETER